MPKLSKNRGKEPKSNRAPELPANDQLDQENTNLNQIPQFPQIPPIPNLEDLTPAEREFQQRMLIMEVILHDVIHENTRLQSRVVDLELQKENPALAEKNTTILQSTGVQL